MEDILRLYTEQLPEGHEVHCFDETPKPLRGTPRGSIPAAPGRDLRTDYEYERTGRCNIFVAVAPFQGTRTVTVTENRKLPATADFLWQYCMEEHADVLRIHLVLDNLNTHSKKALARVWGETKAARFFARVTFHNTPCHGSWLNMAELEINCLKKQGVKHRIETAMQLRTVVAGIVRVRNDEQRTISWSFTVDRARNKFPSLYENNLN